MCSDVFPQRVRSHYSIKLYCHKHQLQRVMTCYKSWPIRNTTRLLTNGKRNLLWSDSFCVIDRSSITSKLFYRLMEEMMNKNSSKVRIWLQSLISSSSLFRLSFCCWCVLYTHHLLPVGPSWKGPLLSSCVFLFKASEGQTGRQLDWSSFRQRFVILIYINKMKLNTFRVFLSSST